jgi:uncharacterized protein
MQATTRDEGKLPPVIQAMLQPEFYPHPVTDVELKQTHTSYVLLAGDFAYKVRKAVRFTFIDCSAPARRLTLCRREAELNRRLSPDIYLAVIAIRQSGSRVFLDQTTEDTTNTAIEYAVMMRRLPEDRRLDRMLTENIATAEDIEKIAITIRNFHANTPNTHSWAYGAAASIWTMMIRNLVEIEQLRPGQPLLTRFARIEHYCRHYVAAHWELLNHRARQGCIREGHGDLRADAVYLTADGIRIIDCLEFDERLRYGDIANEVAFLAMDIDRLGRAELSRELVAHFDEPDVAILIPFYKCYRATVRAKVELLRSRQPDCSPEERQTALGNAARLVDLALGYSIGPKALVIVCGVSGTGKSTLASRLGEHLGFTVFSSDAVRKRIAGIDTNTPAAAAYNQGIYTPEFTSRVYDSLAAEAGGELGAGHGVILDATFSKRGQRQLIIARAKAAAVEPLFIECRADNRTILQRLSRRAQDSKRVSDATEEIYLEQIREFEPLDELPPRCHQVVNTARDLGAVVLEIERGIYSSQ